MRFVRLRFNRLLVRGSIINRRIEKAHGHFVLEREHLSVEYSLIVGLQLTTLKFLIRKNLFHLSVKLYFQSISIYFLFVFITICLIIRIQLQSRVPAPTITHKQCRDLYRFLRQPIRAFLNFRARHLSLLLLRAERVIDNLELILLNYFGRTHTCLLVHD